MGRRGEALCLQLGAALQEIGAAWTRKLMPPVLASPCQLYPPGLASPCQQHPPGVQLSIEGEARDAPPQLHVVRQEVLAGGPNFDVLAVVALHSRPQLARPFSALRPACPGSV